MNSFPLSLAHSDRPDFILQFSSGAIGIEHTEAVPENTARSDVLRRREGGPSIYFPPHAKPGEPIRSAAELRKEIAENAPGEPSVGDAPEREWAEAMLYFCKEKVLKANRPGFARYTQNWLLIFDNWTAPAVVYEEAAPILSRSLSAESVFDVFDRVFVLGSLEICEFNPSPSIFRVRPPNEEA